jgi:aldose sugar dehydrogenase
MKKGLFVFTALVAVLSVKAQTNIQQIESVIQLYFDGWGTGDTTKLGKAMHSTCHLKFFRDGKFTDITRGDYLSRFKPRKAPDSLVTRIVALDITENIASAKAEIDIGKDVFTDYFNMVRTNEGWFIVDKVSVRRPK